MISTIELTLRTPLENLEFDLQLLQQAERESGRFEILRFWESPEYFVVLGNGSSEADDVNTAECRRCNLPVLRRWSGGGTVLLGPGCLNFSLVLSVELRPQLRSVAASWHLILAQLSRALALPGVRPAGVSDLTLHGRKFSGNAQRRGRHALLHHGTILYDFDIAQVTKFLAEPRRQPAFREQRTHQQFLCNLPLSGEQIRERITRWWREGRKNQSGAEVASAAGCGTS